MPPRGDERAPSVGRLLKRPDFLAAASGRRFHNDRMTVQGRLRGDEGGLRVGLTVTRKVGHATERNRIKRRLRAAVQEAGRAHADAALDAVIIARRSVLGVRWRTLVDDLARALQGVRQPARPRDPKAPETRPEAARRSGGTRADTPRRPAPPSPAAGSRPPPAPGAQAADRPAQPDSDGSPHA